MFTKNPKRFRTFVTCINYYIKYSHSTQFTNLLMYEENVSMQKITTLLEICLKIQILINGKI